MIRAHGWSSAPTTTHRSSALGRGCATLAAIALILFGLSMISQAIVTSGSGVRGNEGSFIAIGLVGLLAAAAVWLRWLRRTGSGWDAQRPRLREPASHERMKQGLRLLENSLLPRESSTDLLQWAWLISLDLAFREHLWVRIVALLASILVVFIVIPVLLALLYDARLLR